MNRLIWIAVRLAFYPALWFNRLMCALGIWHFADWVDDWVVIGALPHRKDLERLASKGVAAVINMCEEFAGDPKSLAACGLIQLRLPTLDYHCPSEDDLRQGLRFIREQIAAHHKVFIHCKAGRGRSATLALCYLMSSQKISAADAYAVLKSRRRQLAHGLDRHDAVRRIEAGLKN